MNLSRISYLDKDFQNIINLLKNYHKKNPENKEVLVNLENSSFAAGFFEDALYFHKKLVDSGKFEITGNDKEILPLHEAFMKHTFYAYQASERNLAKLRVYDEILQTFFPTFSARLEMTKNMAIQVFVFQSAPPDAKALHWN